MRYLLIGADFVPTESTRELFIEGNLDALFGKALKELLLNADYRIFNLETPLTDVLSPIPKCGPNLIAPIQTVNAYKEIKVDLLTLANNHIFDQNISGMRSTCDVLKKNDIAYMGVGENAFEAAKPHYINFVGKKIGIYACCEHEFGYATEHRAGANSFEPLESLDHILKLKNQSDYVIVLYHGGKEHYRYPSPSLQKTCRKIIEKGADLVVCQHSHCVGCKESYLGGTIVYGQGNFLFDYSSSEYWNTGVLISLNENMEISYIPLRKHENVVRLAESDDACQIVNEFYQRSEEIQQDGFVEKKYKEFADSMGEYYLFVLSGGKRSLFYKAIDKMTGHRISKWQLQRKYSTERKLALYNFIECEAHRELLLCGLENNEEDRCFK